MLPADGTIAAIKVRWFGTPPGSSTIKLPQPCGGAEGGPLPFACYDPGKA